MQIHLYHQDASFLKWTAYLSFLPYIPGTNCKFIVDFKRFKIKALYGLMFTSHAFRLYNIDTCFSTHPNGLSYCSAVTPHSFKISDSVTSNRVLIVTI